jgi:exonuclease III
MASLSILQWNARGLLAHCRELKQAVLSHQYDVVCVQESWLKDGRSYEIRGYETFQKDRTGAQKAQGGVAMFVKRSLKYSVIDRDLPLEAQSIRLSTEAGHVTVTNVYWPQAGNVEQCDRDLEAMSHLFVDGDSIVVGDFNAKNPAWGSPCSDRRGRALLRLVSECDYVVLNDGRPTRLDEHRGSMSHIDLTFSSKSLASKCTWNVINNSMGSDHCPIRVGVNDRLVRDMSCVPKWKLQKADWAAFVTKCDENANLKSTFDDDVDRFCKNVTDAIVQAAEASIPQTGCRVGKRTKPLPYWSADIKSAIYERNRAKNKWRRTRLLDDGIEYRRLKAAAQRLIRDAAKQHWQDYCATLSGQTRLATVWGMARKMNGARCSPSSSALTVNGTVYDRDADKAELLAQRFAEISSSANYSPEFRSHKSDIESNNAELFANDGPDTTMSGRLNAEFSQQELHDALAEAKRKSSPGEDRVTYEFLQKLPPTGRVALLKLFNSVWRKGQMPKSWLHAIVVPILKVGKDPRSIDSYRPISLTSSMCKLMERMVTSRLRWYLERHRLLSDEQSGFRRNRSTMDHVVRLHDAIVRQTRNRGFVLAVFLDFERAFDMVWRKGLMIKLKRLGINGRMFDWIDAFLNDRTFQVRVGTQLSKIHTLENGTAQGANFSPLAFISMIDDLTDSLENVESSLFADDSMIYKGGRTLTGIDQIGAERTRCDSQLV